MFPPRSAFRDPPAAERPTSPGASYGVPEQGGTVLPWTFVIDWLTASRVYWLATVRPDGRPHAMPIWGLFVDDDLYLETSPVTRKARNLEANPAAVVHVGDADAAVIVEGSAFRDIPERALGMKLASAFAAKYPGYQPGPDAWDDGGLYRIGPSIVFAWRDMPTATRWRFGNP